MHKQDDQLHDIQRQIKVRQSKLPILCAFLVLTLLAVILVGYGAALQKQRMMEVADRLAENEADKLQYVLDSHLLTLNVLETLVLIHRGELPDFETIARQFYSDDSALRSIQLAPDGVVSYVYPTAKNEGAAIDLFADPERMTDAKWSRDSGQTTLSGPYALAQGGMGLVARSPIYLPDETGEEVFWGFGIIVLNVPEIFDVAGLNQLGKQGYDYRIWRTQPDSTDIQVITESTDAPFQEPVEAFVSVPNATWHLALYPQRGWVNRESLVGSALIVMAMVVLSTLAFASYLTVRAHRKELLRQLNIDPLTGLYNSRFFIHKIKALAAEKATFTLFYLDMNYFKQINDQYGHDEGDKVLIEVAYRIQQTIGEKAYAARMGGDEFTILLPAVDSEEACEALKARLKERIARPFELFNGTIKPTISAGYARYPQHSANVEKLMRLADTRMYEDKRKTKAALFTIVREG